VKPSALSLSLHGLGTRPDASSLRRAVSTVRGVGVGFVQLDATAPGLRARDLDRSARRELAAMLRRAEAGFSGLDLFIPPEHFASAAHADRAVAATAGAVELAADLARLVSGGLGRAVVHVRLPRPLPGAEVMAELTARADACGVVVADCALSVAGGATAGPLRVGLETAECLVAGDEPGAVAARLGSGLGAVRLADVSAGSSQRCLPGRGRLNLPGFAAGLIASGFDGPVVLDLRGVPEGQADVAAAARAWGEAFAPA
jgi:sugar phosphate isomerase/epimerase